MAQLKKREEIIKETVSSGGFLVQMYFDIHGKEKDVLQNVMIDLIGKITGEKGVADAIGKIEEPIQAGDEEMFSTSAQVQIAAKNLATLFRIVSHYSPIGVEIIQPHDPKISLGELQGVLMDVAIMSNEFSTFAMKRLLKPEEVDDLNRQIKAREKIGKHLREKTEKG
ncbi:Uncharacterised protein [Candidatus Gugararchaeum adminiculabundum]|nr:Uncharacterised protein [Candidatus Gugararchaeum adminiculabundum]